MRHTLFWQRGADAGSPPSIGDAIELVGDEAMHAVKSKRLREGDACLVCDGAGVVATCAVVRATKSRVELAVEGAEVVEAATPRVEVWGATPKGQRLDKMLDMLAQCGCALWRPMSTERGVVEPGAHKLERAERISVEALKQCGRAHLMAIGEEASFADALDAGAGTRVVVADAGGTSAAWGSDGGTACVRLLVGPEGGFTPAEMALARERGAAVVRLGVHVMRIETASVVGCAWAMTDGARAEGA
jgi:16S rRNA (uracil1498-N3)-methyltransferase